MKAPRSAAEILGLWEAHKAKAEAAGTTAQDLYRFAENLSVTRNELLGAALAESERNTLEDAAVAVDAAVSPEGIVTVETTPKKRTKRTKK